MDVVMSKNKYEEGTPEYKAFEEGVEAERTRLVKILTKYHQTFGSGDITESETTMQIKNLYEFATEARTLK